MNPPTASLSSLLASDAWQRHCQALGLTWDPALCDPLAAFYVLLTETNAHTNLTRITGPEDFLNRHVLDSLTLSAHLAANSRVADIGSGGGFPAVPLALFRPDLHITAIESVGKKARFIEDATSRLGLSNLAVVCDRSEVLARDPKYRERFDAVTARAVAALPLLLELTIPLLKPHGRLLALKGPKAPEEIAAAESALDTLACEVEDLALSPIEALGGSCVLIVQKTAPTPKLYPRPTAQMKKRSL